MKSTKFRPLALLLTLTMVMMVAGTPIVTKASVPADAAPVLIPLSETVKKVQEQNSALIPVDISLESENGTNYYVVKMLAQDGSTSEIYINANTGLIDDGIAASAAKQDENRNDAEPADTDDQGQASESNSNQDAGVSNDDSLTVTVTINQGNMNSNNDQNNVGSKEEGDFESRKGDKDMNENTDDMLMFSSIRITMLQAIETAISAVPDAEVTEASLDVENGVYVYMVKLVSKNGIRSEVPIDAVTGSIITLSEGNVEHKE